MEEKEYKLDLSLLPAELKLIIQLLSTDGKIENDLTDTDWELFIKLAVHHRIFPNLYPLMAKKNPGVFPDSVMQKLSILHRKNTFQMLHLSNEMVQISQLFAKQDIPVLFLKGPVLSMDLYGDLSLRTSRDLDLLIPFKDLERAEMLLADSGFKKDEYFSPFLGEWKWRHHHTAFFHPVKDITVEVHWRLNPGPGKEPCFRELWDRRRLSSLTSHPVFLLGEEDLFIFLAEHGARHGWSRLRWLLDIHLLIEKPLNWRFIKKQMKKYHSSLIGGQVLLLHSQVFSASLANEMDGLKNRRAEKAAEACMFYLKQMINLHSDPVPKEIAFYHSRYLFSIKSFGQKLLFLLSFLYPYPIDAETFPLPKRLHFLYFPLRPFLAIWRKARKQAIT
ncbi:nucleotidyltransferase family protein [Bacillus sp. FJAT-42376]|uniref:nucleotidyltransferase domain-containing protein n=1 Tax=Bacillus sp. FJAT-42376 TaxID=2014076 RepID=UPI001F150307|nr:nucleotidyltransferase family protein [Bacillus sp. FJAT-42376]